MIPAAFEVFGYPLKSMVDVDKGHENETEHKEGDYFLGEKGYDRENHGQQSIQHVVPHAFPLLSLRLSPLSYLTGRMDY